jgi:hypothetical protein
MFDRRAVVEREGLVVYYPRRSDLFQMLDPASRQWLDEHPEWPGSLVEEVEEKAHIVSLKSEHKRIVERYLWGLQSLVGMMDDRNGMPRGKNELDYREMYLAMRDAHVFEFSGEHLVSLHSAYDKWITELAGYEYKPYGGEVPEEEADNYMRVGERVLRSLPHPMRGLPFSSAYYAFGVDGAVMSSVRAEMVVGACLSAAKGGSDFEKQSWVGPNGRPFARTFAYLLTEGGDAWELFGNWRGDQCAFFKFGASDEGWSTFAVPLAPLISWFLTKMLNDADTVVREQGRNLSVRLAAQKTARKLRRKVLPPPYYRVTMRQHTQSEQYPPLPSKARDWSHRWDVVGHAVYRVRRGVLPLDPELKDKLLARKYRLFRAGSPMDNRLRRKLISRNIPLPRPGEWVAVLKSFRKGYVKGPKDRPYIPSTRKLEDRLSKIEQRSVAKS